MELDVLSILNDVAESNNVTNQHLLDLQHCFNEHAEQFIQQFEKGYLKIIKHFNAINKTQRKVFETLTERFFGFMLKQWNESTLPAQKTRKQINKDNTRKLILHFLQLFSEGLESTQFPTRICCGRLLFMVLKCMPPDMLNTIIDEKLAFEMLNSTVGLFRNSKIQKTGKTQKGLAVKLGSYLQHINSEERKGAKLKQAIVALKSEMVRTICEEDKKELRLDALTNTELNEATLSFIIIRIRDTDVNVRLQVFKKIMKNKLSIHNLQLLDLYQVVYDGLRNSSTEVQKQCEQFLIQSFLQLQLHEDQIQEESAIKRSGRKSYNPKASRAVEKFISAFQVEKTLIFPQLYQVVQEAFKTILTRADAEELGSYFKELLTVKLRNQSASGAELCMLKVLCNLCQNVESKKLVPSELSMIIDHNFPEGMEFAQQLAYNYDILQLYEILQLAGLMINCDELGRNSLLSAITKFISYPIDIIAPRPIGKCNEIYEDITEDQLESRWFGQHHFETPIIRGYYDLMLPALKVIKHLISDQDAFIEQIIEVITNLRATQQAGTLVQLQQQLNANQNELEELTKSTTELNKKKKQNASALQLNEQLQQQCTAKITTITNQLHHQTELFNQVDIHCLYLLDALFCQFDINKLNDRTCTRLKSLVMSIAEKYTQQPSLAQKMGFRCMGYIPLFGLDHGGSIVGVLASILDKTTDDAITITALRSVLDALLMYDGDQSWQVGAETFSKQRILQIILNFAIKSNSVVQSIALEGLSKLLIHQKIAKPSIWIATFLFLWFDNSLRSKQLPLQIVTSFFKLYITSSLEFLTVFERGLEMYFSICCYLHYTKDQKLNEEYFQTEQWQQLSMIQAAQVGIKMMSYKNLKSQPSLAEFQDRIQQSMQTKEDYYVGPQERLLICLSRLVTQHNNIVLKPLFQIVIKQADFIEQYDLDGNDTDKIHIKPALYEVLSLFTQDAIEKFEKANLDVKNESNFLKVLSEELSGQIGDESEAIRDSLNAEFETYKTDASYLVKDLKRNGIIVTGEKLQNERVINNEDQSSDDGIKKRQQSSDEEPMPKRQVGGKRRR